MFHHRDGLVGVEGHARVEAGETEERGFGFGESAVADESPGGFGRKVDSDRDGEI